MKIVKLETVKGISGRAQLTPITHIRFEYRNLTLHLEKRDKRVLGIEYDYPNADPFQSKVQTFSLYEAK